MDKWSNARVIRPDDKWRSQYERDNYGVSKDEYDLDVYPTYCGGPCTLLSGQTMIKSYETAKVTNPGKFTMEDILFTGIIRVKSNLPSPGIYGPSCLLTRVKRTIHESLFSPNSSNGICNHYNDGNKLDLIKNVVEQYCKDHEIQHCLVYNDFFDLLDFGTKS